MSGSVRPPGTTSTPSTSAMGARRAADEARHAMSSAEYLDAHDLPLYLVEALKHVHRVSSGAGADASPNRHIEAAAEYFQAVATGRHVVGRDFAFVQATQRNRHAFLLAFERAFADSPAMPVGDWREALGMLCPDVPATAVEDAFDAALDATGTPLGTPEGTPPRVPFAAFFPAFAVAVEHAGFLAAARDLVFADKGADEGADEGADTYPDRVVDGGVREALAALARTRKGAPSAAAVDAAWVTSTTTSRGRPSAEGFARALCGDASLRTSTEESIRARQSANERARVAAARDPAGGGAAWRSSGVAPRGK